jgi:indolepyruvate ferredoxin oxidoreductase beta subunit
MKKDIVLAGVGGQGVLAISTIIARTAHRAGLEVKQVEVHGMAQRGGAVQAHLRLSDEPIASDLIPMGTADLILATEPVESLRYLDYLAPDGVLVTSTDPVLNVPNYPEQDDVLEQLRALPGTVLFGAQALAKEAGSTLYANSVVVGAASHLLPLEPDELSDTIEETLASKGPRVVDGNLAAFEAGREAVACERART